jgi:hypothetical protein
VSSGVCAAANRYVLLSVPESSSCVDLLGPPVEAGGRADEVRLPLQGGAAGELGVLQLLDAGELAVDEHGIGEWPQMLCRLQLGRVDPLCQGH